MPTDDRVRNRRNFRQPILILGLVMTIIYLCLGGFLLVEKTFLPGIPPDFRNIFATMLLVYGVFRGWRVIQDYY
jgi:hypothetical protein